MHLKWRHNLDTGIQKHSKWCKTHSQWGLGPVLGACRTEHDENGADHLHSRIDHLHSMARFWGQNPSKINTQWHQIIDRILKGMLGGFCVDVESIFGAFLDQMAIKVDKRRCYEQPTTTCRTTLLSLALGYALRGQHRSKNGFEQKHAFWNALLMDFGPILEAFLKAKSSRNRCRNVVQKWMRIWRPFLMKEPRQSGMFGVVGGLFWKLTFQMC